MTRPVFPTLSPARMRQMLEPPQGRIRLMIDTDTHNEIDDQFALAWALLSEDVFDIEGALAAPYSFAHHQAPLLAAFEANKRQETGDSPGVAIVGSYHRWAHNLVGAGIGPYDLEFVGPDEGMEPSYQEAAKVYELLGADPSGAVFRGSPGYLRSLDEPYECEAVAHLIERAMADDQRPLYVAAIGALTNVASAMLIEPRIIERIVVLWTSAYPSWSPLSNRPSLNLI